ncbi:restriction endonuclease subunit S [Maribacter sp. Hel_I_7]|uniref:restriction endonuclease subunit S n=1 Tax=Maribacter sp. Hel_I_7 TaxID=1249997 RepID=UPI00068EACCF|nr:restriction endonuclease subunit S [Maribacter sp. Hel_I_7]
MKNMLPKNWVETTIGDLFTLRQGIQVSKPDQSLEFKKGMVQFLRIVDFTKTNELPRYVTDPGETYHMQKDDIALVRYGTVGFVCYGKTGVIANNLFRVIPNIDINKKYVTYYLKSSGFQHSLVSKGATMQALSFKTVNPILFPLPPLAEQQRIVAKLDVLFNHLDTLKTRLDHIPQLLKNFRQAVLTQAVTGKLTEKWRVTNHTSVSIKLIEEQIKLNKKLYSNYTSINRWETPNNPWKEHPIIPKNWGWFTVDEIRCSKAEIVYGIVQPGPKLTSGVPYIRGLDIVNGKILQDQLMNTSEEIAKKFNRSKLIEGDAILGIIRHSKVATIPEELDGVNMGRATARIRPSIFITPKYLNFCLSSPLMQLWIKANSRGIDMPVINLKEVRKLPVPIPSVEEQTEIVNRVEHLFTKANAIEAQYLSLKEKIDSLPQAILAKAFKGELVRQLDTDGDAKELLEEIKKLREIGSKKSVNRMRKK